MKINYFCMYEQSYYSISNIDKGYDSCNSEVVHKFIFYSNLSYVNTLM